MRSIKKLGVNLLIGATFSAVAGMAVAETTIRATSWLPPKHPANVGGFEPFMDYVKKESKGQLDFKFWSGGALANGKSTLPTVRNGIADIGVLALSYFPAEFPYFQLIADMAMYSDNAPAIAAAVTELVVLDCKPCRDEYTSKGLVFTSSYSTTPYTLISKTPINGPDDLKGKKFRSAGSLWDRWTNYVGGTPVNVSSAEMFEALDRGGVDVAIFSPAALKAFSLWDIAKYDVMLELGTYASMSLFTMNQGFWRDLTPEQRKILLDGSALGVMGVTFSYMDSDEDVLKEAGQHQVNIVKPAESLVTQRNAFIEQETANLPALAKKNYGIDNAEEIIKRYRELLKKWEGIVSEVGLDRHKLAERLQQEVYSKVDLNTYGM